MPLSSYLPYLLPHAFARPLHHALPQHPKSAISIMDSDSDSDSRELSPSISPLLLPLIAIAPPQPRRNHEGNFPRNRRLSLLTEQIMRAEEAAAWDTDSDSGMSAATEQNEHTQNDLIFDFDSSIPTSPGTVMPRPAIDWDDIPPHGRLPPGQYSDGLDLRYEAEGMPPPMRYLISDSPPPLAGEPIHIQLEAEMIDGNGKECLPLHPRTIRMMSGYYEGTEDIAKTSLFECMLINIEINDIHLDHWNAILGLIGRYCTDLIIVAPIFTTDQGGVLRRDLTDFCRSNDWEVIFQSFPYLETLTWEHPEGTSTPASRGTLLAVHRALSSGRCLLNLHSFRINICENLCRDLLEDIEAYDQEGEGSSLDLAGQASFLSLAASQRTSPSGFRMWGLYDYRVFF
jgi:hypothetical protein